jgi:hypothetical protein
MSVSWCVPQPDDPDAELREVFNQIDEDASNRLTKEELQVPGRRPAAYLYSRHD